MPALIILAGDRERAKAHDWIKRAPVNSRISFSGPKRSLDQSAKMWAMLTQIAEQVTWHGQRLTTEDFKLIFLDALKWEVRIVPALDNRGFVSLGRSSSKLSKEEMSELLDLIAAWGAQNGVTFSDLEAGSGPQDAQAQHEPRATRSDTGAV